MKVTRRDGKIVIVKHPTNGDEIEAAIEDVRRQLTRLRAVCEDRSTEAFPHEVVQAIVERCEYVRENTMDIAVDEALIASATETGSVSAYFEARLQALLDEEAAFNRKKECFRAFSSMLRSLKDSHFS